MKRLFDLALALAMLFPLVPFYVLVGWILRRDSPGPIFYRGERIGRGGRPFRIYKFRTMVVNAERIGGASTSDEDPRITRVGKALRKYKIDELPQVLNVLEGTMSFVGPRPEVKKYTDLFNEEERAILSVPPGITDWASLWNSDEGALLANADDPDRYYEEHIRPKKIRLQLEYVRKRSMLVDLRIVAQTAAMTIRRMLGKDRGSPEAP